MANQKIPVDVRPRMTRPTTPCRFSRLAFGGGEAGELAACEALAAHEALLVPGARVRVYRGEPAGMVGEVVGERGGGRYAVREETEDEGEPRLTWEIESRNLELVEVSS